MGGVKTAIPEGVVCKGGSRHGLWMCKIKTLRYLQALQNLKPHNWEDFWE